MRTIYIALFGIALVWGCNPAAAATGDDIGSAVRIVNLVSARYAFDERALAAGDDVRQDELIAVSADGTGELRLRDDTKLALGPGSQLLLDKFVYDPDIDDGSIIVNLVKGTFRFITGIAAKPVYEIRTPTASITVRGTIFDVYVDESDLAWLLLIEGAIEVCNALDECRLHDEPGKIIPITADGEVGNPVKWASLAGAQDTQFETVFPFVVGPPEIDRHRTITPDDIINGDFPVKPPRKVKLPKRAANLPSRGPSPSGGSPPSGGRRPGGGIPPIHVDYPPAGDDYLPPDNGYPPVVDDYPPVVDDTSPPDGWIDVGIPPTIVFPPNVYPPGWSPPQHEDGEPGHGGQGPHDDGQGPQHGGRGPQHNGRGPKHDGRGPNRRDQASLGRDAKRGDRAGRRRDANRRRQAERRQKAERRRTASSRRRASNRRKANRRRKASLRRKASSRRKAIRRLKSKRRHKARNRRKASSRRKAIRRVKANRRRNVNRRRNAVRRGGGARAGQVARRRQGGGRRGGGRRRRGQLR